MKRLFLCFFSMMISFAYAWAQDTIIVALDQPGTLEDVLGQISKSAKYETASLKVQGPIDGTDMMFIRDMCGVTNLNTKTQGILSALDLGDAYIMESQEPYISVYGIDFTTHIDEFGPFFLYNCANLTQLILPESIEVIDTMAFAGCVNLTEIELPGTLRSIGYGAFVNCNSLKEIHVPDAVTELGVGAFQRMEALETLSLGNGLTEIENSLIVEDNSLRIINLGMRIHSFNPVVFYNTPSLMEVNADEYNPFFTSIDGVLYSKETDTLVVYPASYPQEQFEIPLGVKMLAPYSFYGSNMLQTVTLPESLITIDSLAFFGCENLAEVRGGKALSTIRFGAFGVSPGNGASLMSLQLPATVSLIEGGAFFCNPNLQVKVDNDNPYYVTSDDGVLYNHDLTRLCYVPALTESFEFPITLETIGEYAFAGVMNLPEIQVPDQVTTLCDEAFAFAAGTSTIVLGPNVSKVGAQVIDYCESLTDLYLFADDIPDDNLHPYSFLDESGMALEQCVLHVKPGLATHYMVKKGFYSEEYETFFFANIAEIENPDGIGNVEFKSQKTKYYGIDGRIRKSPLRGLNIIKLPTGNTLKMINSH